MEVVCKPRDWAQLRQGRAANLDAFALFFACHPSCACPKLRAMDDEGFLAKFEAGQWPLEEWHHRQHIKVAYLYLRRHPFEDAVARVREKIQAHNAARGIPEGPTSGYHETMTQAWMRLVYLTLCEYGAAESADAFFERSPQLSEKKTLRLFYSRDCFMAPRAKTEFVEPDLGAFPRSSNPPPPLI